MPAHALSLTAFYSQSDADSGTVAEVFDVTGAGTFAGVRLRHVLLPVGAWSHAVSLGVEDHLYENDSTLLGVTPIGVDVRSRALAAGYSANWEGPGSAASFGLAYVRNLVHGGGNDRAAYLANQAGARPSWDALRGEARYDRAVFDDWLLRTRSSAQWAGEPLISGERFGVGGAASVRGLEEREISADDGVYAGIELWTPPLGADVRLLGFVDLARYRQRGTATGTVSGGAASAGLGLRWYSTGRASLLVDVARVIDGAGTTRAGDYGVHVNLLVRY